MLAACENRQPSRMAAMPNTFENVRLTNRLGARSMSGQRGDAGKFVVRLVDQHHGLAGALQDALDAQERNPGPGGIVGIGEDHGARRGSDGAQNNSSRGNSMSGGRYSISRMAAPATSRIEAVHGVRGTQQQHFVSVIHICVDENLNGFVGAIGQQTTVPSGT